MYEKKRILSDKRIKEILVEGIEYFHSFCQHNHLTYYLAYGSLLGAVRHKGFIPWDDDIDIWMPRPDYDRLVLELSNAIDSNNWEIISVETNPNYLSEFAKFCHKHSIITPCRYNNGFNYGLSVDIFPLDTVSHTLNREKFVEMHSKMYKKYSRRISLYGVTRNNQSWFKQSIKKTLFIIANLFSRNGCHQLYLDWAQELRRTNYVGSYYLASALNDKCAYEKKWFDNVFEIEFEGIKLNAPIGFDNILTMKYGNYQELPPEDERKPKHNYLAYIVE